MRLVVGTDFDGTISSPLSRLLGVSMRLANFRLPVPWFFFFLQFHLLWPKPNRAMVEELRRRKKGGDEIIIVTARPWQASGLTKRWLKKHKVPFDQLFCIGSGSRMMERKLSIVQKEGVVVFYDDDLKTRKFLEKKGVEVKPPPIIERLAQWPERCIYIAEVAGSSPASSICLNLRF